MQIATINQPSSEPKFEPTFYQPRKTRIMPKAIFANFLRKFFWMNKQNHGHSIHQLSDHLQRDMGLIERDLNPKPRHNDHHSTKLTANRLWL